MIQNATRKSKAIARRTTANCWKPVALVAELKPLALLVILKFVSQFYKTLSL